MTTEYYVLAALIFISAIAKAVWLLVNLSEPEPAEAEETNG